MDISDFSEFYLTLPSNSSRFNNNNTKANFKTDLIEPLKLKQPYEVALVEMILPIIENNTINLGNLSIINTITKSEASVLIKSDFLNYISIKDAVIKINNELKSLSNKFNCPIEPKLELNESENSLFLVFNNFSKEHEVYFTGELSNIFGINSAISGGSSNNLGLKEDSLINFANNILYIYTDIINYQYVGDVSRQLLKTIFIDSSVAQLKYFSTPHYVPVIKNFIDSIKITIKDSYNELVKFISGTDHVLVKLHFRPQRYGF